MSIIRVRKDEKYFTASNEPFVDTRLSWEARGLMGYLLSKPNNWEIRNSDLENQGPAGEHKLRRMLAELRQCGYMNRIRIKHDDGTFTWTTEVYESPSQNPKPNKNVTTRRLSTSGSSTSGKPPDIVKTDEENTEKSKEGAKAPRPTNIEQAIFSGQPVTPDMLATEAQQLAADIKDAAWLICQNNRHLEPLAIAFMETRGIVLATDKTSQGGHRKALKQMYEAKPHQVKPEHVRDAILKLKADNMTVKDLFSIVGTAIDLANPMEGQEEDYHSRLINRMERL